MLEGIPDLIEDLTDFGGIEGFFVVPVREAGTQVLLVLVVCMCYDLQSGRLCKIIILHVQRREAHIQCFLNHKGSYIREMYGSARHAQSGRYKAGHIYSKCPVGAIKGIHAA